MTFQPQIVRSPSRLAVAALLAACQAPFGVDRHDLVGDRISAITTQSAGPGAVAAHVWLTVDDHAWAPSPVDAAWFTYDGANTAAEVDAIDRSSPVATGLTPTLSLPEGGASFVLTVTFPSGVERTALLSLGGAAVDYPEATITLGALPSLSFTEATPEELALDARAALVPEPADQIDVGAWSRLSLAFSAEPPASFTRARWMNTRLDTTFLELSDLDADWATGAVLLDDLEIDAAEPAAPGVTTLLALAQDATGHHRAWARELWIGAPPPGGLVSQGRWIASDLATSPAPGARVAATLQADDTAPTGLLLTDAAEVSAAESDPDDPWGTAALGCGAGGPFNPTWLFDGSCARDAVVGARVVLEVQ